MKVEITAGGLKILREAGVFLVWLSTHRRTGTFWQEERMLELAARMRGAEVAGKGAPIEVDDELFDPALLERVAALLSVVDDDPTAAEFLTNLVARLRGESLVRVAPRLVRSRPSSLAER